MIPVSLLLSVPAPGRNSLGSGNATSSLLSTSALNAKGFEELAGYVREFDPSISTRRNEGPRSDGHIAIPRNPTLIFSPALIRHTPTVQWTYILRLSA